MRAASCSKRFLISFGIGESRSQTKWAVWRTLARVELLPSRKSKKLPIIDSERSFDSIMTEDLPNHQLSKAKLSVNAEVPVLMIWREFFFFPKNDTSASSTSFVFAEFDEKYTKGSPRLVNQTSSSGTLRRGLLLRSTTDGYGVTRFASALGIFNGK